jgi:hypothetical protein
MWSNGSAVRDVKAERLGRSRRESGSLASILPRGERAPVTASGVTNDGGAADCRTCPLRARCITYGWRSPGGLWFENAVVLRPTPGCRGYVGRGADILGHFGEGAEPADETSAGVPGSRSDDGVSGTG